ncbi:MAG: ABC transporter permease [Bacteroidota bacterium]
MFKLNLKIALRNLWNNKAYTAINIFGLAAGLSGFLIILIYINFETGYDKWDPSLKQVYQVGLYQVKNGAENKKPLIEGHFVQMIREHFPEVEMVTQGNWGGKPWLIDYKYNNQTFQPGFVHAGIDSLFFKVYPIKATYGVMEDIFKTPGAVAISLSKAKEIFGTANPINKVITRTGGANFKDQDVIIKAVWDDNKYKSYFGSSIIGAKDFKLYGDEVLDVSYNVLLKLRKDVDIGALSTKINQVYLQQLAKRVANNSDASFNPSVSKAREILKKDAGITTNQVVIESIGDLNLNSYFSPAPKQKSIYILTALATFLIVISCVNFTNLAIVQASHRAKEVGVRKVLGAYRANLTRQFLAETSLQCLVAFFITLVVTELMLPSVNELLGADLTLVTNANLGQLLFQCFGILLVIIVLSGLYPAFFLSGFLPSKVLKGNFASGTGPVFLRKTLMIVQFTIAGALVISFVIMKAQLNYMKESSLGMKPDQVMALQIQSYDNRQLNPAQFASIKQRLLNINGVKEVSRSTDGIISNTSWKMDFDYKGSTTTASANYNDFGYLKLLKAEIVAGRDFSEKLMATDTLESVILNETAARTIGLKQGVGEVLDVKTEGKSHKYTVIGIIKDIKNEGFDKAVKPTVYLTADFKWHWRKVVYLRISSNEIGETIKEVRKTWKEIEPKVEPVYSFADYDFAKLNAGYERMAKVMFSFSFITLLVSLMGLFSLAAYNSKIKVKEIAIRKILGASTTSVLKLLNADMVKLVIIANVLADLCAYIYMQQWFTTFVYRIDIPLFPFLLVNMGTIVLTIITVSVQSIKAVKASPVKALKYE